MLLTLAAFHGVSRNGFVAFDDDVYLIDNPLVREGLTARGVRWAFTTTTAFNWHPLTWLSHQLDVQLFGMRPGAHHLVSLGLHTASAAVLLALLRSLTGALWPSALVAALFAVHPLRVESVAWAAERKDVLSLLLALCAALAYARAARRGRAGRSAAPPLLFAAALLAKPLPVTLPFLLLLLDWWPLGRWSPTPGAPPGAQAPLLRVLPPIRLWAEKLPLFTLAAASSAVTYLVQNRGDVMSTLEYLPLPARAANAIVAYAGYLAKAVWPHDLAVYYPHIGAVHGAQLAGTAALALLLTVLCLGSSRRRPYLAVGWLWYLGTLVPMIGLVQVGDQAMADRYTYLPLTGVFLAAVCALAEAVRRRPALRPLAAGASAGAILALAVATGAQVRHWRDTASLFTHALCVTSGNWMAHNNLGVALAAAGRVAEAEEHFRGSLAIKAGNTDARENLARVLIDRGRADEALPHLHEVLRARPDNPRALFLVGRASAALWRHQEAVGAYEAAVRADPAFTLAWNNLGDALLALGRPAAAVDTLRRTVALDPGLAVARANLGRALEAAGDLEGAVAQYREAVRLAPGETAFGALLGAAQRRQGR
jgi:Flp pilus assembly protein TadD